MSMLGVRHMGGLQKESAIPGEATFAYTSAPVHPLPARGRQVSWESTFQCEAHQISPPCIFWTSFPQGTILYPS